MKTRPLFLTAGMPWLLIIFLSLPNALSAQPLVIELDSLHCPLKATLAKSACRSDAIRFDATKIQSQGDQCRFLDANGRVLGSRWYNECGAFYIQDVALACAPGPGNPVGCGLVNRKGDVILPTIYQQVRVSADTPIVSIRLSDKWGFFDLNRQKVLLAPQFAFVNDFSEGYAYVEGLAQDEEYPGWFIDSDGSRMAPVPAGVQRVGPFKYSRARAVSAGRWGYLNYRAEWVIPAQFLDATDFINGRAMVKSARSPEQWALIDGGGRGLVFFEGASHQLKSWQGDGVLLEYGCDARDNSGLVETCINFCFSFSAGPVNSISCAVVSDSP
jgi:hypothetical protein